MRLTALKYYALSIPRLLFGIKNWPLVLAAFFRLPIHKPFMIALRQSGLLFNVRSAMDIWIIKETCLDRDYERAGVALQDDWTILDIGAGLGDFTAYAARRCLNGFIYAYEPFPESFELLKQNLELNNIHNVQAMPYAVAGVSGRQQLNLDGAAVQHSMASSTDHSIEVAAVTLDQVFTDNNLKACHFLKIDVEGAEYAILFNVSESTLRRIKHIVLEYHDNVSASSHEALGRFLHEHGFQIRLQSNPVHLHLGYLYALNLRFGE